MSDLDPRELNPEIEPELRDLLSEYFTRHGLRVRTAADALQARAMVAQALPDLAILDINMPGENGLSLAQKPPFTAGALFRSKPGVAGV